MPRFNPAQFIAMTANIYGAIQKGKQEAKLEREKKELADRAMALDEQANQRQQAEFEQRQRLAQRKLSGEEMLANIIRGLPTERGVTLPGISAPTFEGENEFIGPFGMPLGRIAGKTQQVPVDPMEALAGNKEALAAALQSGDENMIAGLWKTKEGMAQKKVREKGLSERAKARDKIAEDRLTISRSAQVLAQDVALARTTRDRQALLLRALGLQAKLRSQVDENGLPLALSLDPVDRQIESIVADLMPPSLISGLPQPGSEQTVPPAKPSLSLTAPTMPGYAKKAAARGAAQIPLIGARGEEARATKRTPPGINPSEAKTDTGQFKSDMKKLTTNQQAAINGIPDAATRVQVASGAAGMKEADEKGGYKSAANKKKVDDYIFRQKAEASKRGKGSKAQKNAQAALDEKLAAVGRGK